MNEGGDEIYTKNLSRLKDDEIIKQDIGSGGVVSAGDQTDIASGISQHRSAGQAVHHLRTGESITDTIQP